MEKIETPKVSVVIRTVNRPHLLRDALRSIYCQTYDNIETIIVNDGGESLVDIIPNFLEVPKYNLIEFETNKGRSAAGNEGIKQAQGKYLCFLDDDDIFYPNHISSLVSEMNEDKKIIYSDALKAIQAKNNDCYITKDFFLDYSINHSLKRILEGNFIPFQSLLFDREVLLENLIDPKLAVLEDWDLLIRLSTKYEFLHLKKITSEYRIRLDNTNTTGNNQKLWEDTRQLINNRYLDLVQSFGLDYIPTK